MLQSGLDADRQRSAPSPTWAKVLEMIEKVEEANTEGNGLADDAGHHAAAALDRASGDHR